MLQLSIPIPRNAQQEGICPGLTRLEDGMCHLAHSLFYIKTTFNKEAAGPNCLTRRMPFTGNHLTAAVR